MVSTMTFSRAKEVFDAYLKRCEEGGDAESKLLEHLGWDEPREEQFAGDVRIVLVSSDFSKEITTAALWLNERDLDIRCVRLRPYVLGDETIIDVQQVVPLPETEAYTVQLKQKEQAARHEKAERHVLRRAFWQELLALAGKRTPRFAHATPSDDNWIAVSAGFTGLKFNYMIWKDVAGCDLYIDRGSKSQDWNKTVFDYLKGRRQEIESAYGRQLQWYRMDEKRACRIMEESLPGGIRSSREDWPGIHEEMIATMQRFEAALAPRLREAVEIADSVA